MQPTINHYHDGLVVCTLYHGWQAGKSLMVNAILPSLIREDPSFGVGKTNEVTVFSLSVDTLPKV